MNYLISFQGVESLLKQIGLEQWIMGYSKGNTINQHILYKIDFSTCSGVVDYNVTTHTSYILHASFELQLTFVYCEPYNPSMIDGLIVYSFQLNQYYWIMFNTMDATMHLMKNLYWILSLLLFVCFHCVKWFKCVECINYINVSNSINQI